MGERGARGAWGEGDVAVCTREVMALAGGYDQMHGSRKRWDGLDARGFLVQGVHRRGRGKR